MAAFALSFCTGNTRASKPRPVFLGETLELVSAEHQYVYLCQEVRRPRGPGVHLVLAHHPLSRMAAYNKAGAPTRRCARVGVSTLQAEQCTPTSRIIPCCMQVHHNLRENRFIQAWAAHGAAGWTLQGECEPEVSLGMGTITVGKSAARGSTRARRGL